MEDVWIKPADDQVPLWLEDQNVCQGIRGLLKRDRCVEERRRLGMESDNLCRWYGTELVAVELALRTPGSQFVVFSLLFAELTGYRRDSLIVSSTPPQPITPPSFTLDLTTRICATLREPGKGGGIPCRITFWYTSLYLAFLGKSSGIRSTITHP